MDPSAPPAGPSDSWDPSTAPTLATADAAPHQAAPSAEQRSKQLQEAFVRHVNAKACYGKRVATDMDLLSHTDFAAYSCQQFSLMERRMYVWTEKSVDQYYRPPGPQLVHKGREPWQWAAPSPSQWAAPMHSSADRYSQGPKQAAISVAIAGSEHVGSCDGCNGTGHASCRQCGGSGGNGQQRCMGCNGRGSQTCSRCKGCRYLAKWCELQYSWHTEASTVTFDTLSATSAGKDACRLPTALLKKHLTQSSSGGGALYKGEVLNDVETLIDWRVYGGPGQGASVSVFPLHHPMWTSTPPALKAQVHSQHESGHWNKTVGPASTLRMISHRILVSWMPVIQVKYHWSKATSAAKGLSAASDSAEGADKALVKDTDQYTYLVYGAQLDGVYEDEYPLNCCGCLGESAACGCSCVVM